MAVRSQLRQIVCETPSGKYPTENKASGVAQVVEGLPNNHEALSLNVSTTKNK
jgi:hypothetical protein